MIIFNLVVATSVDDRVLNEVLGLRMFIDMNALIYWYRRSVTGNHSEQRSRNTKLLVRRDYCYLRMERKCRPISA